MGLALRKYPRDSYTLSTKVGYFLQPQQPGDPVLDQPGGATMPFSMEFDYGYGAVMRQFEDSLQRLGVARVDCLVIHGMDYSAESVEGVDRNLEILASGGMVALHELRAAVRHPPRTTHHAPHRAPHARHSAHCTCTPSHTALLYWH